MAAFSAGRRNYRVRRGRVTAVAAVVLLSAAMGATLIAVGAWSGQRQEVVQKVGFYRLTVANERGSLNNRDGITVAQLRELQGQTRSALGQLESTAISDAVRADVQRLDRVFQAAVAREIDSVAVGDKQQATHLDLVAVEGTFDSLNVVLGEVADNASRGATVSTTIDDVVSILVVVATALIGILMIVLGGRRRDKTAATDAQAATFHEAARVTAERERSFRAIFDGNPQPMWVAEKGGQHFLAVNDAALILYGYARDEFLKLSASDLNVPEEYEQLRENIRKILEEPKAYSFLSHHRTKSGVILDVNVDTRDTEYDGRDVTLVCIRDVTDRVALQTELERRAFHDSLTGLPNRALFSDRLEHAHRRLERSSAGYVVLMLDLDDFKTVNDSMGHGAGDEVLRKVATLLQAAVRSGDTAARFGGDEFAILVEDMDDVSSALIIADHVLEALRPALTVGAQLVRVNATIGVASSAPRTAPWDVVRNADAALYVGKGRGKGRHELFSESMHVDAAEQRSLEQDLREGLGRDELLLHYQPKVDTWTGRVLGVEALVRWNHPVRGLLQPHTFIPVAEKSSLITDVGAWVLLAACKQAKEWWLSGLGPVPVAVNVSGRDLESGDLLEHVFAALHLTELNPALLELELTEGIAVQDCGAIGLLQQIRDLGVRVAMDDFGTGYSMLGRLQDFPMDTLKIDRSFIQRITSPDCEAPIVDATIAMAEGLGLTVVAEGVETEEQRLYLAHRGCPQLQGYLISRAVPPAQILPMLRSAPLSAIPNIEASPRASARNLRARRLARRKPVGSGSARA